MTATTLRAYVPRLVLEWLRDRPDDSFTVMNGSMVFVDISGFTAMSERLAKKGKVGAEEVTGVINSSFSSLLEVAYEEGGSLLKFGGDALLLFFSGSGHELRSVTAAAKMRRNLASTGKISTSAGNVSLRMSVGIHSGAFDLFLAGRSHRELLITGPGASLAAEMESVASAGEILVSPATAQALPPGYVSRPKGDGLLIKRSVPIQASGGGFDPIRGVDPSCLIPESLRSDLVAGVDSEHRMVVAGFVHFGGVDRMLAEGMHDEVCARLGELVATVQAAASSEQVTFLGSDLYEDGGKIILAAGTPRTYGNDEERMLRTLRKVFDSYSDLPLRAGVNAGHVFSGEIGPSFRKTFTIMGDAVNMAARLMQRAAPGDVLTLRHVLDRSPTIFETSSREPFLPKGKSAPVDPLAVGAIAGQRGEDGDGPFVGRNHEVDTIVTALRSDSAPALHVIGEAGIGKTRLVTHALSIARPGGRTLVIRSDRYLGAMPYGAIGILLRSLLQIPEGADPQESGSSLADAVAGRIPELGPWLPLIAGVLGASVAATPETDDLDPSFRKERSQIATATLLAHSMDPGTTVFFDDAHWLDEGSAEILSHLVKQPVRGGLILATRPGSSSVELDLPRLVLGSMSQAESVELLKAMSGAPVPRHVVDAIVERSGGNPLYLTELSRSGAAIDADTLPPTLESLIATRIDSLERKDRDALRKLAVLGESFIPSELALSVFGLTVRQTHPLDAFLVHHDGDHFSFRQSLFRQVAYESLPFRTRRSLHLEVAQTLEQLPDTDLSLLSIHFYNARVWERSWHYGRLAGEDAATRWANLDAAGHLRRAIESARHVDAVPDRDLSLVWERLGMVLELSGRYQESLDAFVQARRLADPADPVRQCELYLKLGVLDMRLGRVLAASRALGKVISLSESVPGGSGAKWATRARITKAEMEMRRGRYQASIALAKRALRTAEDSGDLAGIAHAQNHLHAVYLFLRSPERERYRGLPIEILEKIGDLRQLGWVLNNVATDYHYSGDWGLALQTHIRSRDVRRRSGDISGEAVSANNIGELLLDMGELDEAERLFIDAIDIFVPTGFELGTAVAESNLGCTYLRQGRLDVARDLLTRALARFEELGDPAYLFDTKARIAELELESGRPNVIQVIEDLIDRAASAEGTETVRSELYRSLGRALAREGMTERAREAFAAGAEIAGSVGARSELSKTYRSWAECAPADANERERLLAQAMSIREELGAGRIAELAAQARM